MRRLARHVWDSCLFLGAPIVIVLALSYVIEGALQLIELSEASR